MAALLCTAMWIAGCGGAQAKTDTNTAARAETTKAGGPATAAKAPCAKCGSDKCAGCDSAKAGHGDRKFKMMTAEELKDKLQAAPQVHVVDVNGDARWAKGRVPGAKHILRENLSEQTLPKDKNAMLVFYCGSSKCMASHKAANIAAGLGYTNVWVMGDGIKGWESKGFKTEM